MDLQKHVRAFLRQQTTDTEIMFFHREICKKYNIRPAEGIVFQKENTLLIGVIDTKLLSTQYALIIGTSFERMHAQTLPEWEAIMLHEYGHIMFFDFKRTEVFQVFLNFFSLLGFVFEVMSVYVLFTTSIEGAIYVLLFGICTHVLSLIWHIAQYMVKEVRADAYSSLRMKNSCILAHVLLKMSDINTFTTHFLRNKKLFSALKQYIDLSLRPRVLLSYSAP